MTNESPTNAPPVKLVPSPKALEPKKDSLADKVERLDLGF